MNYKPKHNDMEMWLICVAGGTKREELKNLLVYQWKIKQKKLLDFKYDSLLREIYDIQERLVNQKKYLFRYEWEKIINNNHHCRKMFLQW